ncbi:DNA polymerase delta subunit 3-like [Neodiprion fabricii]|uniref:DNA polymerase delta subunit 3-like n=1 Tax=Neodiprion fabricii TaxID=2872261 RepID=UPI001ED95485|nr:DNA polymerase delta subunit 3-like [Neodiprion fabricii]
MISTTIDTYLETLTGYIFDDDKLVTYKWLSKELGLHVNFAKQILWQFWKEHEEQKRVLATFTLIGYLVDGVLRVEVVKEEDLASAKRKFKKLTAEHLYSLQRALPDVELLALTGNGDHRQGAIVCKEIIARSGEELNELRWGCKLSGKVSDEKSAKLASTKLDSKKEKNFFSKVTKTPQAFDASKKEAAKDVDNVVAGRGRKRQGSEEPEMGGKRQRRKCDPTTNPSGESSVNEDEGEDETMRNCILEGETPSVNVGNKVSPPMYKVENGKTKVRKVVDKTFTDENGYFVTKKEYVYESSSDKEEDPPKVEAPQPRSAAPKDNNRKQASLLNFFKKP